MNLKPVLNHIKSGSNCQSNKNEQVSESVKIYLRRPNKQTTIIKTPNQLAGKQIISVASQKTSIDLSNIVLYLHGTIIQNNSNLIKLNHNDIVHVHDVSKIKKAKLNVNFKGFECQSQFSGLKSMQVKSDNKIIQELTKFIKINQNLIFIQSGRKLNLQKTFQEQCIENQSTIIVTNLINKTEVQRQKQKKEQPRDNKIIQQMRQISNQMKDNKQLNFRPMMKKSMTWSSDNINSFSRSSFKKKQKPSIYKSQKISQTKEVVWESDSSGDLQRKLRKQIPLKKHRQIFQSTKQYRQDLQNSPGKDYMSQNPSYNYEQDINQFELPRPLFSSHDKLQLQKQFKKLLFADIFEDKKQQQEQKVIQKIPEITSYDFLEQSEQIQIGSDQIENNFENEDSDQQQQNQEQISAKKPINLRQSIGKSRGTFVPMIPTRDFDLPDNQDDD